MWLICRMMLPVPRIRQVFLLHDSDLQEAGLVYFADVSVSEVSPPVVDTRAVRSPPHRFRSWPQAQTAMSRHTGGVPESCVRLWGLFGFRVISRREQDVLDRLANAFIRKRNLHRRTDEP